MPHLDVDRSTLRRAVLPAAASIAGAGLGLILTRGSKLSEALPDRSSLGLGDLADDLREKLDSVLGSQSGSSRSGRASTLRGGGSLSADELERRRTEREERRKQRHARR
jgi:hypothetical protein